MTQRGRGRPRSPGILTPAEQRVLEELRRGGTNAEIAARLGVTLDAVKFHISNMLGKLGLENRRQLAAWRPEPRRRLFGLLALPAALDPVGRVLVWAGVAAAGAVALGVVAVVLIVLSTLDGGEQQVALAPTVSAPATATSTATPPPTATPTPMPTATPTPRPAPTWQISSPTPAATPTATAPPTSTRPPGCDPPPYVHVDYVLHPIVLFLLAPPGTNPPLHGSGRAARLEGSEGVGGSVASDREALVALYHALGGEDWCDNENWLTASPLSTWDGVTTNDAGRVTMLHLWDRLGGSIPPELGNLTHLNALTLSGENLSGPIPPELVRLTHLEYLQVWGNLSGPIPPELTRLTYLEVLDLSGNDLSGPIPPELSRLTHLRYLNLADNGLSGPIPAGLGSLTGAGGADSLYEPN